MKIPTSSDKLPELSFLKYISLKDAPLSSRTQDHLPIADIVENIVLFKNGGASLVMESTSLNFGLLSEMEQLAVIAAYKALINSLTFSIQITVKSQRKDISNYIKYLDEKMTKIKNPKLLYLMHGYKDFISETIKKKKVLSKKFYLIIPFSPLELGITKSIKTVTKRGSSLPYSKSYFIKKAKISLYPKRDHLIRQAGRLGLKLRQLTTHELVDLYYQTYNHQEPFSKEIGEEKEK